MVPKVSVVNLDDASHKYFLQFWAERHYGTTLSDSHLNVPMSDKLVAITGRKVEAVADGTSFIVDGQTYVVPLRGEYQVRNALQAIAIGRAFNMNESDIAQGLASAHSVPGRAEYIDSERGWQVVVDYALTPHALTQLYESLNQAGAKRIIGVLGAAGGGRDTWKRPELGKIAAQHCTAILLTTDDPYDEEPAAIAAAIAAGVPEHDQQKVEILLDRREAITKAMSIAQPGDVIAITGMGSETSMMVKGKKVEWSDIGVVRKALTSL
jgi:UDP-N-acetylmuramoyl-L-alanyl-D-glutamate--2,6-diaminopimelate ligase